MNISDPEQHGFSTSGLKQIDQMMVHYLEQKLIAGGVTLVARQGQVVHFEKFGLQDIAANTPMALDTIFHIYSMTKPITSVALMMLYEQGLVQLTDPITKFIPQFEHVKVFNHPKSLIDLTRNITIQDLLCHTAGLSYGFYEDTPVDDLYRQADLFLPDITLQEMVRRIADLPLVHQPGTGWRYSVATDVIGHLVEIISDMSLAQFFAEKILNPLGMVDTAYTISPKKATRMATLYSLNSGNLQPDKSGNEIIHALTLQAGGHGLLSTATDYLRFAQCMLNQGELDGVRLLSPKTVDLMTKNQVSPALLPLRYNGVINKSVLGLGFGLGFRVMLDADLAGISGFKGDYGWGGMANTVFWIDPQKQLVAIAMVQCFADEIHPIKNEFRTLVHQALY
ncbi:serine hydrolase domain-containing protein [Anaerolineales bacterium HSG6]|nr:serine hydrolase domain-containing protein [Anaerolineales bacterium HSG6]